MLEELDKYCSKCGGDLWLRGNKVVCRKCKTVNEVLEDECY